jgi:hypothetical protein
MALLFTSSTTSHSHLTLFSKTPNPSKPFPLLSPSLSFTNPRNRFLRSPPSLLLTHSSLSDPSPNPRISDEWGEPSEPEPEPEPELESPPDPPNNEDEWGGDDAVVVTGSTEEDEYVAGGNGSPAAAGTVKDKADVAEEEDGLGNKLAELKRCLVDTVYGTELGFRAGQEVRAELSELVSQLEAANPTPAPTEAPGALDGNWVLL